MNINLRELMYSLDSSARDRPSATFITLFDPRKKFQFKIRNKTFSTKK